MRHNWFTGPFVEQLVRAQEQCVAQGMRCSAMVAHLSRGEPRPWRHETWLCVQRGYQRTVASWLRGEQEVHTGLRHRFNGFDFPECPRQRAVQASAILARLARLVPPRLHAAGNGWLTARRFHAAGLPRGHCVFRCHDFSNDDVEHYSACSAVWVWSKSWLYR